MFEHVSRRILSIDGGGILDRVSAWSNDNILPIKVYGMSF
jgi:hypothetical protein